jgi:hypothetical protein
MVRLLGAKPVDYRAVHPVKLHAFDEQWTFSSWPRDMRVELVPQEATVLAVDQDSLPLLLANKVGRGSVTYALPIVEEGIAGVSDTLDERSRWQRWYAGVLQ